MNAPTEILSLVGGGDVRINTKEDAIKVRDELLVVSTELVNVTNPQQAQIAANVLNDLKAFSSLIESSREATKAPVLEWGRKIDSLAKELKAKIDAEYTRIGRIHGEWQAAERRKVEEAERKAREEEQRIWREAQERERLAQEKIAREAKEAADKAAAEAKALEEKAARARTEAGREKALQEAEARRIQAQIEADTLREKQEQERAARALEASKEVAQTRIAAANVTSAKSAGVATKEDVAYEITDMEALYKAFPYLCEVTERVSILKTTLKALPEGKTLPGVKHWKVAKTHVR